MLKEIILAIQSFRDAHRFINRHKLWKWIIIPGVLYMLMFGAGVWLFWQTSTFIITTILTETGLKEWLAAMQDDWWNLLVVLAQVILWLTLLMFYFSIFKYLFLILGAPLFAWLSEKTESAIEGIEFKFSWKALLHDVWRAAKIALRNLMWQCVYMIFIFLLSFVPVVGWAAPVFSLLIECYYFGFSMLDYTCERNRLNAAESIRFIGNHKGLAIGNGIMFFAMHLIPIAGWLLAPSYAVIAATLSIIKLKNQEAQLLPAEIQE